MYIDNIFSNRSLIVIKIIIKVYLINNFKINILIDNNIFIL